VCREQIRAGDRYRYSSGVWDGVGASLKHCARCWAIYCAVASEVDYDTAVDLVVISRPSPAV
jgi:hypothetical protein